MFAPAALLLAMAIAMRLAFATKNKNNRMNVEPSSFTATHHKIFFKAANENKQTKNRIKRKKKENIINGLHLTNAKIEFAEISN